MVDRHTAGEYDRSETDRKGLLLECPFGRSQTPDKGSAPARRTLACLRSDPKGRIHRDTNRRDVCATRALRDRLPSYPTACRDDIIDALHAVFPGELNIPASEIQEGVPIF